jgi:hypothetical protein
MANTDALRSRDFFLQTGFANQLADADLIAGFARVSDVFERYGADVVGAATWALWSSQDYRRDFFGRLRNAAWLLRAGRSCGSSDRLEDAKVAFAEAVQLLGRAGFDLAHVRTLIGCLSHSCICDGCDLVSGVRFDRLAAEMKTPTTVSAAWGRGRVDPTNEPEGGTYVDSAREV